MPAHEAVSRTQIDAQLARAGYLRLAWDGLQVRQQIESRARTTAGIYKINQRDIGSILIPMPADLVAQRAIAATIDAGIQAASRASVEIEVQVVRAARLRRSILKSAFDGRLVPQDANDEPASVVLDRVRSGQVTNAHSRRRTRART